jgi:dynactin complex subunit
VKGKIFTYTGESSPSPNTTHSVYVESVNTYEDSIRYLKQNFETDDNKLLDEFFKCSDQANENIKSVLYEIWTNQLNPN